jgi:thiol-disulfide isomerase/thioredoxin
MIVMFKIVSTKLIVFLLLTGSVLGQDKGMQFFHGSWSELLAEAKKNNKLIFVDVYTEWCGPCKMMAKEVFPLEEVGEKYNSQFINYKLDAEKGEGIELSKKFNVPGYPTYLYLNSKGDLLHRGIGYFKPDKFIQNAEVAVAASSDPVTIGTLTQEYESGKKDKEFLKSYIGKLIKMQSPAEQPLNDYFAQLTAAEKEQEGTKLLLLQALSLENKEVLAFLMQQPQALKEMGERSGVTNDLGLPLIDNLSNDLIMGAFKTLEKGNYSDYLLYKGYFQQLSPESDYNKTLIPGMDMEYLAGTGKIDSLVQYASQYADSAWTVSPEILKEKDAEALKEFMQPYLEGKKDSTKNEYYPLIRHEAATKYSQEAADVLKAAAKGFATTKFPVKKSKLEQAYRWNEKALQLVSENDYDRSISAQLLFKMGRKAEARKIMDMLLAKAREEKSPRLLQSMEKIRNGML